MNQVEAADILREKGIKRVGPYRVTQTMGSTTSANLVTAFGIRGVSYSTSPLLASRTRDPEHLRALESLDLNSAVIVPLQARGRVLGALSFT